MNFLQKKYALEMGGMTPYAHAFLASPVLNAIQDALTSQLQHATGNPDVLPVELTELIQSALMDFALRYREVMPTPDIIRQSVANFADEMATQNETRYYETAFWRRWCSQGFPDPNNVPLPLAPERTDFTIETSDYMLSHPVSYRNFPTC